MADKFNKVPTKLYAWAPEAILPDLYPQAHAINRDRPRDVVLIGTVNALYDLRLRWQSLVGAPRAQRLTQ
jgi:hypothetical protein